jgi:trehalose synthase
MQRMLEMVEVPPTRPSASSPCSSLSRSSGSLTASAGPAELLGERTVWNVSSTAKGGGVVELLLPLIGYAKGAGVDARWAVIEGNPDFFKVTKRIHNFLHGFEGDGGDLDDAARKVYEDALGRRTRRSWWTWSATTTSSCSTTADRRADRAAQANRARRSSGAATSASTSRTSIARRGWDFLRVDVDQADAYVFSRDAFVWEGLDDDKVAVIAPSIDAFNAKNQELEDPQVHAILAAAGIVDGGEGEPTFKARRRQRGAGDEPGGRSTRTCG